ncbi:phage baseplate assembly protein V [Paracandidimonas soli]|uniref:phage baseplate assembly protein V n=1 Tax=Paracandidimonas soli TaxID=1917182 RepID=UPI0036146FD8
MVSLVDPARLMQVLQLRMTAGETKDGVEHFEPYGYTAHPLRGAEHLTAFMNGDRSHAVVLCVADRRHRVRGLKPGEVCLYTDEGDEIRFQRGRVIGVTAGSRLDVTAPEVVVRASVKVTLDTPLVHATKDIKADGHISDALGSMQGMRDRFNGHDHPGDSGGTTGKTNQRME